jgi:MFS family permease
MLPYYQAHLTVSGAALGVLSGAYAAGTLVGSLPAGWLAARWGPARITTVGLALLSSASLVFTFGDGLVVLVAARFAQGLGGACSWIGALTWVISIVPEDRRGRAIGTVMGFGFAGALLGPVVGTLAREFGLVWPFGGIAVIGFVLIWTVRRLPAPQGENASIQRSLKQGFNAVLGRGMFRQGAAVMFVAAFIEGALNLVVPIRLDQLGSSAVVLGAAFLIAGALQAGGQRAVGGIVDARGPRRPVLISFLTGSVLVTAVGVIDNLPVVVITSVIVIVAFGVSYTPATALLYRGVGDIGADPAFGAAIVNLTWAGGQAVGAIAAGVVSDTSANGVAFFVIAAVGFAAAALVALRVGRTAGHGAPSRDATTC